MDTDNRSGGGPQAAPAAADADDLPMAALAALRAEGVPRAYARAPGLLEDPETALSDFSCDVQHWCDRNGVSFHQAADHGHRHYGNETQPIAACGAGRRAHSEGLPVEASPRGHNPDCRCPLVDEDEAMAWHHGWDDSAAAAAASAHWWAEVEEIAREARDARGGWVPAASAAE